MQKQIYWKWNRISNTKSESCEENKEGTIIKNKKKRILTFGGGEKDKPSKQG